jgi:hypothetical protein
MKTYVQTVRKNWRTKMKTIQNNQREQPQPRIQAIRKQAVQKPRRRARDNESPVIKFSPTAWAKLLYFRDKSDNEIGGFGITAADDLLFVQDFVTVKQEVTGISVKLDDAAVADFFDSQIDLGRKPEQFARIWLHTHPGDSPEPSIIDEDTFARVFGNCHWAVMFVLAQNDKTHARLRFNVGPGGQILLPLEVDYDRDFGATDRLSWDAEFQANVKATDLSFTGKDRETSEATQRSYKPNCDYVSAYDFVYELERMEPAERELVFDELAARYDLWHDEESEEMFL